MRKPRVFLLNNSSILNSFTESLSFEKGEQAFEHGVLGKAILNAC